MLTAEGCESAEDASVGDTVRFPGVFAPNSCNFGIIVAIMIASQELNTPVTISFPRSARVWGNDN